MSVRHLLPIVLLIAAGSVACGGSPTAADGTVTITRATAPPPPIPQLLAGAVATSPTGSGITSATLFTFPFTTAPSGGVGPYTIAWNFGDGNAGAGTSASHVYSTAGNFTATATVTDSRGITATASAPVSIRNVTGRWTANISGFNPEAIDVVQDGTSVTATINETADGFASGTGSVSNPRTLSVSATFLAAMPAPYAVTFVGTLNDTLLVWTGTVTGYMGCPCSFTATRPSSGP